MSWFKRSDKGILTPTEAKREVPDGLWFKSPAGKIVHTRELKNNAYVVPDKNIMCVLVLKNILKSCSMKISSLKWMPTWSLQIL